MAQTVADCLVELDGALDGVCIAYDQLACDNEDLCRTPAGPDTLEDVRQAADLLKLAALMLERVRNDLSVERRARIQSGASVV